MSCPFQYNAVLVAALNFAVMGMAGNIANLLTIPYLVSLSKCSYDQYKANACKKTRTPLVINGTYTIFAILYVFAHISDDAYIINDVTTCSPDLLSTRHRWGRVLTQYCFSSLILVFLLRFYNFIDRMVVAKPSKIEINMYFWYSICSILIFILLYILALVGKFDSISSGDYFSCAEGVVIIGFYYLMYIRLLRLKNHDGFGALFNILSDTILFLIVFQTVLFAGRLYFIISDSRKESIAQSAHLISTSGLLIINCENTIVFVMNIITARLGTYYSRPGSDTIASNITSDKRKSNDKASTVNMTSSTGQLQPKSVDSNDVYDISIA